MTLAHWFRRLLVTKSRPTTRPQDRPRARPRLEVLEDRLAPANNISIVTGGSLTIPAGATTFANHQDFSIDPSAFTGAGDVTLQANQDLNVANALPILASGQDLTFQAGRHLSIGANIQGANALFRFTANDPGADPAERPAGDSLLTMQSGASVSNTGGRIDFIGDVGDSAGANLHPNSAIFFNTGASVTASGGLTLTASGGQSSGILINGATVNGNGGNISLSGAGVGVSAGMNNNSTGIRVRNGAKVQTTGSGTITLLGTGSAGVEIAGTDTVVSTVDGLLSITGTSPSSFDLYAHGLEIELGAIVEATGLGGVSLTGSGSPNGTTDLGVYLRLGGTASVHDGPLTITGTGRSAAATDVGVSIGVNVEASTVRATGSGTITIQGIAAPDTAAISFANTFGHGTGTLMAGSGNVTLSGDVINFGPAGSVSGTGQLLFQPLTLSRPVRLGGGNTQGRLVFTDTNRAALANGFSQITFGRGNGTGVISTASNLTFASDLVVQSASAGITITHTLDTGANDLTLTTAGPVAVNSPGQLRTSGLGSITVNAGASLAVQSGAVVLSDQTIALNGDILNLGSTTFTIAAAALQGPFAMLSGNGSNDTFILIPGGSTPLSITGGGHSALPTVTASATASGTTISRTLPVGDVVNVLALTNSGTYTLTATQFQRAGTNLVSLAGVESLTVNLSPFDDTVNLFNTPAANVTLLGAGGADTFNLSTTAAGSIVTINATANSSTATNVTTTGAGSVVAFVGSPGFDNLLMLGSGANSGFNFNAGNGGTYVSIAVTGLGSVTQVVGGLDADQVSILNFTFGGGVLGQVSMDLVDGPTGIDGLFYFDQSDPGMQSYTLTATTIDRAGAGQISFTHCDALGLITTHSGANVLVLSTAAGTTTNIVGGEADDSFGFLAEMRGLVVLDAGGGSNSLVVSAANRPFGADGGIAISSTGISDGQGVLQLAYFATGGTFSRGITLLGTPFNDFFFVLGTRTDSPTVVDGQGGNDGFGVDVTTQSNYTATLAALVTLNGGTGTNSLHVRSASPGATIQRTITSATSGGLTVTYPPPGLTSILSYLNFDTVTTSP